MAADLPPLFAPQQLVPEDWYEVREEIGRHTVGENEAELTLHPAAGHFEEPREGQFTSIQSVFVAVEANPGTKDDCAHKVNITHELDG